jgi:hypothetical protein
MQKLKMVVGSVVLGTLFLVGGCGKNEAVKAAEDMADEVCKCKDLACAQEATSKGTEKLMKLKDTKGTEDDAKKILKAGEKMSECMSKLTTAGAGGAATP